MVFDANTDGNNIVTTRLPFPVYTAKVRVYPKTFSSRIELSVGLRGYAQGRMLNLLLMCRVWQKNDFRVKFCSSTIKVDLDAVGLPFNDALDNILDDFSEHAGGLPNRFKFISTSRKMVSISKVPRSALF